MTDPHIALRFDRNLNALVLRVMELGGLVEAQTRRAVQALMDGDASGAQAVVDTEMLVDQLEVEIDRELSSAYGRRQPKASELRLLTAMTRTTSNLERVGDEAERIARAAQSMARRPPMRGGVLAIELKPAATLAGSQLRKALDALVRLDTAGALSVLEDDRTLDREFAGFMASIASRMGDHPPSVAAGVDLVMAGKALERIGDHAKSIAECIVYIVQGADLRHMDPVTQLRAADGVGIGTGR